MYAKLRLEIHQEYTSIDTQLSTKECNV